MPLTVKTIMTANDGQTFESAEAWVAAYNPPPRGTEEGVTGVTWALVAPNKVERTITFASEEAYTAWNAGEPWVNAIVDRKQV